MLSPKTPLVGERWAIIRISRSLKVYCILSNAEITCSPDQKKKAMQNITAASAILLKHIAHTQKICIIDLFRS